VPWYLLLNGTEPRWRLHDTLDSADLEKSLARVIRNEDVPTAVELRWRPG
jgi:hypothetical protein